MLLNLHVKNFALIEECEVDFNKGLNILTGETGAGKSIIIDSINYALGAKVPKDVIRNPEEPALIELIFDIDNEDIRETLRDMELDCDEDTIVISRKIQSQRSTSKINGEAVSASVVKTVAEKLLDIHGQHEHQSLLNKKKHLEILDEYGKEKIKSLKANVAVLYKEYMSIKEELSKGSLNEEEKKRETSFLEYEVNEIQSANLILGEDDDLEEAYKRLSNGRKILEAVDKVYEITGYGDSRSAGNAIGEALKQLSYVTEYDKDLDSMNGTLSEIEALLNDFNRDLSSYMSSNDFSEEEFNTIHSRLSLVNDLKGKYGNTIEKILASLDAKNKRLMELANMEEHILELEGKLKELENSLDIASAKLSETRLEYSKKLSTQIRDALLELNFLQVDFEISFARKEYSPNGYDDIQFLISTNPGEPARELGLVASGGELSRIMLAIKTILASSDEIGSLIFDEIDTGISGRTAQKVSEKLSLVSRNHQVICITHLPQIAAMADSHYLIEKNIVEATTISNIRLLNETESVEELARMLGGAKITDAVLANAKEMKSLAGLNK